MLVYFLIYSCIVMQVIGAINKSTCSVQSYSLNFCGIILLLSNKIMRMHTASQNKAHKKQPITCYSNNVHSENLYFKIILN